MNRDRLAKMSNKLLAGRGLQFAEQRELIQALELALDANEAALHLVNVVAPAGDHRTIVARNETQKLLEKAGMR